MKTETTTNIFSTAKKVEKKKATDEKISIGCELNLKRWNELKENISDLEAEQKMIEGEIKEFAREKFLELYQKQKSRPDSFHLENDGGKCLVIMQDRYLSLTDEKIDSFDLSDSCADTVREYSFNADLLEKYSSVISDLIVNCPDIVDSDKGELIVCKEKKQIKKGLIDKLYSFGERMRDVFFFAEPIINLKNAR